MNFQMRFIFSAFIFLMTGLTASAADPLSPFDPRQVRLGGEVGRRIQITLENNLLALDADKDFLPPFQKRNAPGGYIGLGKLIDAAVRFAYYSGDPRALALKRHLAAEALKLQDADGYIGMLMPAARVSALWDVHEMSYLIYGLTSDFRYFKNREALAGARKLADYLIARWPTEPDRLPGAGSMTLHMAVTGSELAFLALHQATGEKKYLDFCTQTRRLADWDARIVTGRFNPIEGHAYAHLSRCLAQLRLAGLVPGAAPLKPSLDAINFMLHAEGMTISGEIGDHECWHDTQEGTLNLGESCASAYLLRFLDQRLRQTADPLCGDLMERLIPNGLFAAQSPDGRQIRYYTPFDGPRSYFKGDTYCCPNNYRRIIAELPEFAYYRTGRGVAVMRGPQLYGLSRKRHDLLKDVDLRLVVIDPNTLRDAGPDASARPDGQALSLKAWHAKIFYPSNKYNYDLILTEFADPDGEAVYFKVPNPHDARFVDDELFVH